MGTAALVRELVPLPSRGTISDKLEYFFEHGDEYDVALFGTSRVFSGLVPAVMEAELADRGVEARVFNLGLPAVGAFEVDYYLRKILDREFERLRLILVEAWWDVPTALDRNAFTHRRVEWHTARQTVAAAQAALDEPSWDWQERFRQAGGHVQLFAWRQANYGRGLDIAEGLGESTAGRDSGGQGYRPWKKGAGHRGRETNSKPLAWTRPKAPAQDVETGLDYALYQGQSELATAHGLELVHILAPGFRDPIPAAKLRARVSRLIDYRPPAPNRGESSARLAILGDPKLHLDNLHFTPEGAEHFSRLVAEDLAPLLRDY